MPGQITALAFAPDGQTLWSGDDDGAVFAWDLGQARRLADFAAHSGPVWSLAVSHGAGALLASGALLYLFTPRACATHVHALAIAGVAGEMCGSIRFGRWACLSTSHSGKDTLHAGA